MIKSNLNPESTLGDESNVVMRDFDITQVP